MTRADLLVLEYLAGACDAESLDAGLSVDQEQHPRDVEQALLLLRLHALLRGEAPPAGLSDRVMTTIRERNRRLVSDSVLAVIRTRPARKSRQRRWIAAAMAAVLMFSMGVAGVYAVAISRGHGLSATSPGNPISNANASAIVVATGAIAVADHQLSATDHFPDQVRAEAGDTGADLRWDDGSEAMVSAHSRMHRAGQDFVFDHGQARFTVRPHPVGSPFTVRTPHGSVTVIGTVFTVDVGSATTVAVERGTVAFQTRGDTYLVKAGTAIRGDATATTPLPGWRLVWADEFTQNGPPDGERWQSWPRPSGINSDIQQYRADRAHVENGRLVITARHEADGWTSASLMARHLLIKPGMRVELRARMPATAGAWPLVWAVQANRWPEGPEVVLLTTTGDPVRLRASTRLGSVFQPAFGPTVSTGFATYAITWATTGVTVERDGVSMLATSAPTDPGWATACAQGLELALELTITAPGAPTTGDQRFDVQYVRVYEPGPSP